MFPDEQTHIASAAASLDDRHAAELRACEEILKTEADVAKRRAAGNRYLELTGKERAA